MNAPIIRKASRKKARLRLGISAPSGAGKTLGSLLLAYGVMRAAYPELPESAVWEKIGMIDTEEGSGELYVGTREYGVTIGEYAYIRLSAPFTAVKYLDSQHAMERAGIEIIIHDSLTHAWAGSGGILDKQGKITDADKYKNSYTAWRHVTPEHNALVEAMLQSPSHIIGTMRSKVDYAMQNDLKGKMQVVKLGLAPIQREGMEYEFTVFFDIDSNSYTRTTKDRTKLFSSVNATGAIERREFIIKPEIGAELLGWLNTGVESIDTLAERMAADIKLSSDLEATFAAHAETIARIKTERPEWHAPMMSLFEARDKELRNAK